jgi:hypothetical protein
MRPLILLLIACGLTFLQDSPAWAGDCTLGVDSDSINGVIDLYGATCGGATAVVTDVSNGGADPIRNSNLDGICVSTAISVGIDPFEFCAPPSDGTDVEVTPGVAAAALRVIPLPAGVLEVQPPNGRTLVNFDTNFFTETQAFDRRVTLLGQRVDLHIVPSEFGWRFGDGQSLTTDEPGSPYPQLDVTHRYLRKGHVAPSVDTTYTATFRVNGGPWRDVPGSVTIPDAPVALEVLTATPTLVGYD